MSVGSPSPQGLVSLVVLLLVLPAAAASPVDVREPADVDAERVVVVRDPSLARTDLHGTPGAYPPLPPTFLRADVDGGDVVLEWEAPQSGFPAAYRIYRASLPTAGQNEAVRTGFDQPYREVAGDVTTFRDRNVSLHAAQYVYVVTAVYPLTAPAIPPYAIGDPAVPDGRSMFLTGNLEVPSNPATSGNVSGSCQWYDLNLPHGQEPPELHEECVLRELPGTPGVLLVSLGTN